MGLKGAKYLVKLFDKRNCIVFGEKGDGKDVIMGNVVARQEKPYISNMNYTLDDRYIPLDFNMLDIGGNTWKNFVDGDILYYDYPYPDGADIFVSDLGVYLPCQYNSELNKRYPHLATFFALSRHLGKAGVHGNTQDLRRPWDKFREQAKCYIRARGVNQFLIKLGIVSMKVTFYSNYDSAVACIEPCRVTVPLLANGERRLQAEMHRDNFFNAHGDVYTHHFLFVNKSKHDDRYFKKLLLGGRKK